MNILLMMFFFYRKIKYSIIKNEKKTANKTNTMLLCCAVFIINVLFVSCGLGLDNNELRVVLSGNPDTLDPHRTGATITSQVNSSIYESLFYSDGSLTLLESYEVLDEGKTWFLQLKKDVLFHHKKELQAEDVVASLLRLKEGSGETPSTFEKQYSVIQSIDVEDDYIVKIILDHPHNGFKSLLSTPESVILPSDLIRNGHNFDIEPVGTGAFVFEEWQQNKVIHLTKNSEYHGSVSRIDSISFVIIKDRNAQLQSLYKQEVDIVSYLGEVEKEQVSLNEDLKIVNKIGSTILVLAMNTRHPELSKLETRKAIAQAIDKTAVLDVAYNAGGELNVFWHSGNDFFVDVRSIFNPDASAEYFREAAIVETFIISVPSAYPPHVRAAEMYQSMLEDVGLSIRIEEVEWSVWLNRIYRKGEFDLTVIGHTGKLDPDFRLSKYGKGESYVGWHNTEFVNIVNQARRTTNIAIRTQLYRSALKVMTQDYPFVFIGESKFQFGVTKRVSDFEFDKILERYDFRNTKLLQ